MRFLMAILAAAVAASTPQPTYLDTLEVRITNLDVVVTDKHGTPVRGLKREDFEVRENGAPQSVTNFSEFDQSSAVAQAEGGPAAAAQPVPETPPPRKIVSVGLTENRPRGTVFWVELSGIAVLAAV